MKEGRKGRKPMRKDEKRRERESANRARVLTSSMYPTPSDFVKQVSHELYFGTLWSRVNNPLEFPDVRKVAAELCCR